MILHSQILGSGKPFVILHGFLGMGDNWKTLGMRWAEDGYEVHLLDLRNHGRSFHSEDFSYEVMAEDVNRYCDEHDLHEIIILGHSMGGKVAMQFAVDFPKRISKLIVADIGPKEYPRHHQDILDALSALDFTEIKSRRDAETALSENIREQGTRLFVLKNLYRNSKKELDLRLNLPVLSEKIDAVGIALPEDAVYNGETLFLAGENSRYIQTEDGPLIKKHFPEAVIETISAAGHWLHADNPDEFFSRCTEFIRED